MAIRQSNRHCYGGERTGHTTRRSAPWHHCILPLLLMGMAIPARGATYYLNTTTGSVDNPGSNAQPWRTLDQVQSKAGEGDTVVIQQADAATYAALWPSHVSYRADTIQQFGITWKFSDYRPVGQFANGDFWVVGPVTIVGILPQSTSVDGRIMNGTMINPSPKEKSQGYDNSMYANTYSPALNVAFNRSPSNPLVVQPGSSLVSTISMPGAGVIPQLQRAAVLTVLNAPAPTGSFRPAYSGTDKTVRFNKSDLNYAILRRLPAVANTPTLGSVEALFAAPWIDHQPGWPQRMQHPKLNMPDYGREIHRDIGIGGLMLHLDFTPEQKQTLMVRYVQLGVDFYGIVKAGGTWNWVGEGGHGGGRKWPILFAGMVLNDLDMKAIGQKSGNYLYSNGYGPGNSPPDYVHFGEDDQTFYVSEFDVALTNGPKWNPDTRSGPPSPYLRSDIGMPEWGIEHSHNPHRSDKAFHAIYRNVAGPPFNGTALAALLTPGAKALWNHNAYFDYTDRYQAFTGPGGEYAGYWHTSSGFADSMWHAYRSLGGAVWPATDAGGAPVLSPIGNRQVLVGETLTFVASAAGNGLTYTATGLPAGATFTNATFAWTPTSGQVGSHQVTFTVSDGQAQDSETITITVSRPNTAPVLGSIGDKSVNENQALSFTVSGTDADGDSLTYSATGLPGGATFNGQTFSWTPGFTQAGSYSVTFTVSDGKAQASRTVAISVADVNRAPALASIGDRSVSEDNTLALTLSGTDPDGTVLTYSATGLPAGATFAGQDFRWTPGAEQVGSHQITFTVSDGSLTASETIAVMVVGAGPDTAAPVVARQSPAPGTIQVPLNNLITFHVTDAGKGVNVSSVTVTLDDQIIYQGNTPLYTSARGRCIRSGSKNDYRFTYQHNDLFDFDHEIRMTVNAADLAGNVMSPTTYSFSTEMRTFASNRRVSQTGALAKGSPATVGDAAGNIWAAWHAGPVGARDIFLARMAAGQDGFDAPVQITNHPLDQCDPDLALADDRTLYVVWQDNRKGDWDIYASVSADSGLTFSKETAVVDADDNQTAAAVVADGASPSRVYVAWQDDRNGNQDIYVAHSANAFASATVSRVTTNTADQTEPDIAVDAGNTVYLVWTDRRSGQADLYAAASNASWTNVPVMTDAGDQTSPALAVTAGGSTVHLLWVNRVSGNADVCYASSNGLPSSPLTGVSIIDDTTGADQTAPSVACDAAGKVFACWQDDRNIGPYGADTDVYFTELSDGAVKTNVLLGDGGARGSQTEPAIALSTDGQPYIVWADSRNSSSDIYCAATTYLDSTPLYSALINPDAQTTIGTAPAAITRASDVSIVVPAGACLSSVRVSISKILNPIVSPDDCLGSYDFGPSGIEFSQPVTVTIPYQADAANRQARAYWYNSLTGALSQQGITDIETIAISGDLYALQFKTTHFTPYYLVASDAEVMAFAGADGNGGCSMSATGGGSPRHLLVPYAIVVVFMAILRHRDRRRAAERIGS
ncbi:MAG TPA: putative Ig domain-containing protein [Sedimentisphaerales bacterium]|nr:putative Ig domain-containing protein [Sedimentisphaerales bacterium]